MQIFSKRARCPIFKYFVVTREVICQKMAPILDPVNFFWVFSLISHCEYLKSNCHLHFTFCSRFFRWRCNCFCVFPNLIVQLKGFCIRIKWGMLLTIATFLFRFYEPVWIKRYLNVCIKSQGVGCNHFMKCNSSVSQD